MPIIIKNFVSRIILTIIPLILSTTFVFGDDFQTSRINPIYSHVIKEPVLNEKENNPVTLFYSALRYKASGPISCNSYETLKNTLTEQLTIRETELIIEYEDNFLFSEVEDILVNVLNDVFSADDYLKFSYKQWSASWSGYDGSVTIDLTMGYWTTYENEQFVDERVTQVLGEIITTDLNNEEIAKTIHDWIMDNVEYDGTYTYYSAFAALNLGTTVCQGYSLLYFKMLEEAGLEARIVESDSMNHAWNMINLCNHWYHTDATWDDGTSSENYYNLSEDELGTSHTWENHELYPQALESYSQGICQLQPTSNAGPDQTVNENTTIDLNALDSNNLPNFSQITYVWIQMSGPSVTLSDTTSAQPSFTTPDVESDGISLTFQLTVTNSDDLSDEDTVEVYINWDSQIPIANAGPDQIVLGLNEILLDSSLSTDGDGSIVSYSWELIHRELSEYNTTADGETPTITDLFTGIYDVTLTVTDNDGLTDTDEMVLEVVETYCFITSLHYNSSAYLHYIINKYFSR